MLIAQLSDPHVRPNRTLYKGLIDSNAMFSAAINHLNSLLPAPDVVLLSGDITEGGTAEEYAVARRMLDDIKQPLLVIPGNHDEREAFRLGFSDMDYLSKTGPLHFGVSSLGPVRIIGLDVTIPGSHHGEISDETAEWLSEALRDDPDRPTILMLHQPPFRTGIGYLDEYRCFQHEKLEKIISRHPAVERIVCGHVHRFIQRRFAGTLICTAPNTTSSIALRLANSAKPASYLEPPGLLLHDWRPDEGLLTHLVPIGTFPGPYEFF